MTYFILGFGISGASAAAFLHHRHHEVIVWDDNVEKQEEARKEGYCVSLLFNNDVIMVISPGVGNHPLKREALERGVTVISDIQLFFRFFPQIRAVGITGTNGKSTTCSLISHALTAKNVPHVLTGNIGISIFSTVKKDTPPDENILYIVELSSYQLETIEHIVWEAAVILNLFPHHLERHGTMHDYAQIKEKIYRHARLKIAGETVRHYLSSQDSVLFFPAHTEDPNKHVACLVLQHLGFHVTEEDALWKNYVSLSHRQNLIYDSPRISVYNDSKATNPHAVIKAFQTVCQAHDKPLYWIGGGVIQKDDLTPLLPHIKRVKKAYFFGESAKRYVSFCQKHSCEAQAYHMMFDAVTEAWHAIMQDSKTEKSIMLFSPGCASFDQFHNFQERGNLFCEIIHNLSSSSINTPRS